MAWATPLTWVTGMVITAAQLNTNIRDDLNAISSGIVLRGSVAADGSTVTGAGVTSAHTATGQFTLTFAAYAAAPNVIANGIAQTTDPANNRAICASAVTVTTTTALIYIQSSPAGALIDRVITYEIRPVS